MSIRSNQGPIRPLSGGLRLTFLANHTLRNDAEGLTEPSGLALARERDGLWTVSDDTNRIFKLWLDGSVDLDKTFHVGETGLEGITHDPTGKFLLVVKEETNELLKIEIADRQVTARQKISDMSGFGAIAEHFAGDGENKGLEGITIRQSTGTIFIVKEGRPGLLAEITPDLTAILDHRILNAENGFGDDDVAVERIDFSGIVYDEERAVFWIVSDKAKRLYLYDWRADAVLQSTPLFYEQDGKTRLINKAEGVAIDPVSNRLYVVQDRDDPDDDLLLYVFAVHWDDPAPEAFPV